MVNLRPTSRARDESVARNHLNPSFGQYPLADIDQTMVTAWIAKLTASGLFPASVQKAQQVLSKCLGSAVDPGVIRANPCDRVKLPRIERTEMLFLEPGQVATLVDSIDRRYRAFVIVAAWVAAGASPKEIAQRAGHSSVVTVLDRYGHLLPGHEDEVNDRLDAMAAGPHPTVSGLACGMDVGWSEKSGAVLCPQKRRNPRRGRGPG